MYLILALLFIQDIEDQHLLIGHVWLLLESYEKAQEHFLASSNPAQALEVQIFLLSTTNNLAILLHLDAAGFIELESSIELSQNLGS